MLTILSKDEFLKKLREQPGFSVSREENAVRKILENVAKKGDRALFDYSKRFDDTTIDKRSIKVSELEIDRAVKKVNKENKEFVVALKNAAQKIKRYHEKQVEKGYTLSDSGAEVGLRVLPIERVGVYVPGGLAAYPSSVLMNVIPAKVAGVKELALITPPLKKSQPPHVNDLVLAAAHFVGINEIYKVGGAHGIAALAFGTESIKKVDKIVGPGNVYVTLAKKLVFGLVGIDKLAGPSEVLVIADDSADPKLVAAEMLAQAEHDPDARAVLVSPSEKLIEKVEAEVTRQFTLLPRKIIMERSLKNNGKAVRVKDINAAVEVANLVGPEHLVIMTKKAEKVAEKIENAGAVFVGGSSPVALGDYIAGTNHVLPTEATARFSSPLGVWDFVKRQSLINYSSSALKKVAKNVEVLAALEGLEAHAATVKRTA